MVAEGRPGRLHARDERGLALPCPSSGNTLSHLAPLTAMGIWGYRHMPDFLGATARSWFEPGNAELRKQERDSTHAVVDAALRGVVPAADLDDRMAGTRARPAAVEVP